ncbi:hypothetical protein VO70_21330 [Aeromonas salmonicida]|nr:hypothetical protein VO70_21330 [Aeromonas salmonicida]
MIILQWIRNQILDSGSSNNRHWKNCNSIRTKNSLYFIKCLYIILNMFQNMGSKDEVICFIGKWQALHIHLMIYVFIIKICGLIIFKHSRHMRSQTELWSKMQCGYFASIKL